MRRELLVKLLQFFIRKILDCGDPVLGAFHRNDQLGQLYLQRRGVAILRVLNEKDHQKRDDRRRSIDHELPSVAISKRGARGGPNNDEGCREQERGWRARSSSCHMRESGEKLVEGVTSSICGLRMLLVRGESRFLHERQMSHMRATRRFCAF